MDDHNSIVRSMVLMKEVKPMDNCLLFHYKFLENIWMGLVGLQYNNFRSVRWEMRKRVGKLLCILL